MNPVLTPEQVIEKTQSYLIKEMKTELDKYYLSQVSFIYYSDQKKDGRWILFYECKPNKDGSIAVGCHFGVEVSNSKEPSFNIHPGL